MFNTPPQRLLAISAISALSSLVHGCVVKSGRAPPRQEKHNAGEDLEENYGYQIRATDSLMTKVAPARLVVGAVYSTLIASHYHLDTNHRDSAVAAGRQKVWGFSGLPVSGLTPPEGWC